MIEYFSTLGGMSALSVLVTETINKVCKIEKTWLKQLISWLVPIIASIVGLLCQLGLFAAFGPITSGLAWLYTILAGLGIGLASNGIYDITGVETALAYIEKWIASLSKKKAVTTTTTEETKAE